jgi:capsid protein
VGIKRVGKHLPEHHWRARRIFPPKVLAAIEAGEATHSGQIRRAVEGALDASRCSRASLRASARKVVSATGLASR